MKGIRQYTVKEAVDNLPGAICFFDHNGLVTLCNHQMHRLVFALTGRDLQSLQELQEALKGNGCIGRWDNNIFLPEDGSAWRFSQECVTTQDGKTYTQITAANVTELYCSQKELEQDNRRLEEYGQRMRSLSANIINLIREEEILNMKIHVHNDIGSSIIATRQFLLQNKPMEELDLSTWKRIVRLLKHDIEFPEKPDDVAGLMRDACGIGIKIQLNGALPENPAATKILFAAIRECMTNAVRHAAAKELYVDLTNDGNMATAIITNDGKVPEGKIVYGGGLTSLGYRVRNYGGKMEIKETPGFEMTITVPIGLEEMK